MPSEKTRISPLFHLDDGFVVRETLLRVEPTVDLYIREKWRDGAPTETKLPVVLLHWRAWIVQALMSPLKTLHWSLRWQGTMYTRLPLIFAGTDVPAV
jgi:hypothetical protein